MTTKVTFSRFFEHRNSPSQVPLDHLTVNNVSFLVAFICYKLHITPNQVTIGSALFAALSFAAAFVLPADKLYLSIATIFALSQFSYLLDCADGQLARATNQTSEFGAYLDHTLDHFNFFLSFGGFFAFAYRHYLFSENISQAHLALIIGFFFMAAKSCRFLAFQDFTNIYKPKEEKALETRRLLVAIPLSLMDHQMSLLTMIIFLLQSYLGFAIFFLQGSILFFVFFRYIGRARTITKKMKK